MKIGLFDIDSRPGFGNLALMKLSAHYKKEGNEVEFYNPLWNKSYDLVFASKIFRKSHKNDAYIPLNCICGGSGFIENECLPEEDEHLMPDYSLYGLNYSLGFTTRGCIRDCGFCIVRQKEGYIKEHAEIEEFLNPKSNRIILLDNNFLALPSHFEKLQKFIIKGWRIDFNQGLDLRLVNRTNAELLAKVKTFKQFHFAWDLMGDEEEIKKGLRFLIGAGIKPYRILVFILCGYDTNFEEDQYRFNELWALGVYPYVMKYNGETGNKILNHFARWVNGKAFKACTWEEYLKGLEDGSRGRAHK